MVFIPFVFLKAFLNMAAVNAESFILVLLVLFLLTVPLGFLLIKAFRLFPEAGFFDRISVAFGLGLGTIIIISLWTMLIKFNVWIISFEIIFIEILLLWYCIKKQIVAPVRFQSQNCRYLRFLVLGFLAIMFAYYSLVPLTTELAIFRDYDLLALGIQENSALRLPIYDVKIYYPPGSSLITALINLIIPSVHIPKIMLNLAYFFAFYLFIMFFQLGNMGLNNKHLGLFFMLALAISPVSRNFVTDGATIPFNTAAIMGLLVLLLVLVYFKTCQKRYLLFSGVILGAAAISHADGLISFLWGILAIVFAHIIIKRQQWKRILLFFLALALISFIIASPFVLHAMQGKKELSEFWSGQLWETYSRQEIHPKPLQEIMFFSGKWLFYLSLLGIPVLIVAFLRSNDWKKPFFLSFLLWPLLIFSSNNFTFLRLAKPFVLFYAINIILWAGIAIPFTLITGFGFDGLRKFLRKKWFLRIFFVLVFGVVFIKIIDYETVNKENVFDSQQGFFMHSFAQRNGIYTEGDLNLALWLKNQNISGRILNPNTWFGWAIPTITKKNTTNIFVHYFYDSLKDIAKVQMEDGSIQDLLKEPILNVGRIKEKNIEYIFIPSGVIFNEALLESYEVVKRDAGAKILLPKLNSTLKHYEIEDFTNRQPNIYNWLTVSKTIELEPYENIRIPLTDINRQSDIYTMYIKHLTFLLPLTFNVAVGNKLLEVNKTTNKLTWSESSFNVTREDLEQSNWIIILTGKSKGIDLKIKRYLPEVDWIELETN